MIAPWFYCSKCGTEHNFGQLDEILIKETSRGFYWLCKVCGHKNFWERPDDHNGQIIY